MAGDKKSIFQIIVFSLFIFFIVVAVFMFARLSNGGANKNIGDVMMWGTYDTSFMNAYLQDLKDTDARAGNITYRYIPKDQFAAKLTEALASGNGPDVFVLTQDAILHDSNKVITFPFATISKRTFQDSFVDEARLLMVPQGVLGLPFSIDPIVMYYNGDILSEAGIAQPPKYWDSFYGLAERITQRDKANNVLRSTIAFGEFSNVSHAKDIIAMLALQAGGNIVTRDKRGTLVSGLYPQSAQSTDTVNPVVRAISFYTNFSNPAQSVYSWNRSLPLSLDAFAQGKLAFYIGYASEQELIKEKNPNLNYSVAPVPQIKQASGRRVVTFGRMTALAVPKAAQNKYGGMQVAAMLTGKFASKLFSEKSRIPSPRRDVLAKEPIEAWALIARNAALISRAWYDPNPPATDSLFRKMIGDVNSSASSVTEVTQRADQEMSRLLQSYKK